MQDASKFNQIVQNMPNSLKFKYIYSYRYYHLTVDEKHPFIKKDRCGYMYSNGTIFHENKNLKRVAIRRSIEKIAIKCFYESALVSITIPDSVVEAFHDCRNLKFVQFAENSQLKEIQEAAFCHCSFKNIRLPRTIKYIGNHSFGLTNLKNIYFPVDSQLETIENAFYLSKLEKLYLPSSIRYFGELAYDTNKLVYINISNDLYQSNKEGTAIFSRDGSELVVILCSLKKFEIPKNVRVIKKHALSSSKVSGTLLIPSSVEIIEDKAFNHNDYIRVIEFESGSRLKSLGYSSFLFFGLNDLIINNENFIKRDDGVVLALSPPGIAFVPRELEVFEIDSNIEDLYSFSFASTRIDHIFIPNNVKRIFSWVFSRSKIKYVSFEDGTELDFLGFCAFTQTGISEVKIPLVKNRMENNVFEHLEKIEFPPNFNPAFIGSSSVRGGCSTNRIISNSCTSCILCCTAN